jgi:hypothetical protein
MDSSNAETADSYAFAFKLGAVGSILIFSLIAVAPTLGVLVTLAVWVPVVLFVLPWLYICEKRGLHIPQWALRGPNQ